MDLFAYASIPSLEPLLEMNGIHDIKRLRGLRLMANEETMSEEDIKKEIRSSIKYEVEAFYEYDPKYHCYVSDEWTRIKIEYFVKGDGTPRWNRIHGKMRRDLKFAIKKAKKATRTQFEMFNKYVGRDDVLYIHTRTGGNNWKYYGCNEYLKQPWYLDHITDNFDSTYCDIYVKIDPETVKKLAEINKEKEEGTDNRYSGNWTVESLPSSSIDNDNLPVDVAANVNSVYSRVPEDLREEVKEVTEKI